MRDLFAIVSQLVFHFRILIRLASSCSKHSPSPSRSLSLVVCDIIKLPAEDLLCRAQVARLEDLLELDSRRNGSKWSTNCLFTRNYAKFQLERNFRKITPLPSDEMSYSFGPKTSRTLCYLSECAPPLPTCVSVSVCFLILLPPSYSAALLALSLSPFRYASLLFALRKLKRNYYNLYYLQLSCPSELAQPRPRLWRIAKVSSALGQEVTRATPAPAPANVVCFVVGAAWPKVQKCMQTTCGNVEIYSYQVAIVATVEHAWRCDTLLITFDTICIKHFG